MKLSEIIAEMENGSIKTYEATTATGTKIKTKKTEEGYFPIKGYLSLDLDWQPVLELGTWQKALQAWADGKPIFDQLINDIKDNDWYCVQNDAESEMKEWEKTAIIAGLMELKRSVL